MGLDTVELILVTEEHFGIEIPDAVAETLTTVGDLLSFVVGELERTGRPRAADQVFIELRQLICHHFAVEPAEVVAEARFVPHLHMD